MDLLERKMSVLRQQKQLLQQEITDNKELGLQVGGCENLFYSFTLIWFFLFLFVCNCVQWGQALLLALAKVQNFRIITAIFVKTTNFCIFCKRFFINSIIHYGDMSGWGTSWWLSQAAGTRTLRCINLVVLKFLTSAIPAFPPRPPSLPLGSDTNSNPRKQLKKTWRTRGQEPTPTLYWTRGQEPTLTLYWTRGQEPTPTLYWTRGQEPTPTLYWTRGQELTLTVYSLKRKPKEKKLTLLLD